MTSRHSSHANPISRAGKIKYIGLSSISSATLLRAIKIAPVDAVQMDYSPFVTEIEGPEGTDLLATTRKLGIACVAAMPLGRGMITSTFASGSSIGDSLDKRPLVMPRFQEANRKHNEQVMKDFEGVAKKKGITIAQLALAWLLKQGDDIIPIPGTKRFQYLEENWKAGDVDITDEEEKEVRKFVGDNEVKGATLPPAFKDYNYRDTADEN